MGAGIKTEQKRYITIKTGTLEMFKTTSEASIKEHLTHIPLYTFIYLQIPLYTFIYPHILRNIKYQENEDQHKTQKLS